MCGCMEQYRCETVIYLLSMLAHTYNTIIDSGVGELGRGRDVVYCLNAT